jgi:predicted 3-demethylubiquinone-9 3-methyltransferase (glyoxalase superfamily)
VNLHKQKRTKTKEQSVANVHRISACLWFDSEGEEAAKLYTSIFPNSKIGAISRYGEAGKEFHGKEPGAVMTVEFTLDGQPFAALNGGPLFKFNEAVSFQVHCETQEEIDHYWNHLSAGGDPQAQQCGWLKDKFGLSWQIVPTVLAKMMADPDTKKSQRAMQALLQMKKLEIAKLQAAFAG